MAGDADPDAEALDWIVELQEHPDDVALRRRFDTWRAADPRNEAAWAEAARVYAGIGDMLPVHADRWGRQLAGQDVRAYRSSRPRKRQMAVFALGVAAAVVLAIFLGPTLALHWQADVVTGTGELREVHLADGSMASLAPDSAIGIDYASGRRRVTLLRGRAWFDVRHDSARPFQVIAHDVTVTDVGTAFEVGFDPAGTTIAVARGAVHVDDRAALPAIAEDLDAGQWLSVTTAGKATRDREAPDLVASWRDGRLAVEGRPMREVVDALRSWYGGIIVVTSDTLVQRRVTGVYDLRDPAGALTALATAYGGRVRQVTPWLLVLSAG